MNHFNTRLISTAVLVVAISAATAGAAEVMETWEGSPYRIRATLAIDAPGELARQLAAELPQYLHERVSTAIGSVWQLNSNLATGPMRQRMLRGIEAFTTVDVADGADDEDKRLLLTVRATPQGYELSAREFDRYVQRWGPTIHRSTRQRDAVAELLFELVTQAVAPLAHVLSDPQNPRQVILEMRGSDLPASGADFSWVHPGDVFQPLLRRTTRDGLLMPGGVTVVPWTFLEIVKQEEPAERPIGRIRNVTQRPLGIRRGRVEQLAIGLQHDPGNSVVELHSRLEQKKPLVGYEVVAQNMDEKETRSLGKSDAAGDVKVSPGKSGVQML
jgi:hypothetical protein